MTSFLIRRLQADQGFTIVEVLVSALLLVVIALGVFASLDTASGISGSNKARAIASGLAQEDLERLRSFKAAALTGLDQTRPQRVAGVLYTIVSRTDPVSDPSGAATCASNDSNGSYLKASSTVTWPAMRGIDPVRMDTLIAQPNPAAGALAVTITNAANGPVPNIPVTITGPETFTESTNSEGCVLYGNLPIGEYTITVQAPGYVEANGTPLESYSRAVEVVGQSTTTQAIRMDRPGTATISFRAGSPSSSTATDPGRFTLENSGFATGPKLITTSGTSYSAPLFPFTDAYKAYAGDCTGADPSKYGTQPPSTFVVPSGGSVSRSVYEPKLAILIRNYTSAPPSGPVAGAKVYLTKTAAGCSGSIYAGVTGTNGRPPDEFFPYGTYRVCAQVEYYGTTYSKSANTSNTTANAAGGAVTIDFTDSTVSSVPCG